MFEPSQEAVYVALGVLTGLSMLGVLRVLAGYRMQVIGTYDTAREVQKVRAEYHRRLVEKKTPPTT